MTTTAQYTLDYRAAKTGEDNQLHTLDNLSEINNMNLSPTAKIHKMDFCLEAGVSKTFDVNTIFDIKLVRFVLVKASGVIQFDKNTETVTGSTVLLDYKDVEQNVTIPLVSSPITMTFTNNGTSSVEVTFYLVGYEDL